jgi:DNA-binding transcriptional LysR family regulator
MRNLDLTALRSFVAVAEAGGVTRAAGQLNLTQSAVSMQLKRLEQMLEADLLERTGRGVVPTAQGEQLLGYARRMVALNDEALARLTGEAWEGELRLGVPGDIVYPHVPAVLARFARSHPRVRVSLVSAATKRLLPAFGRGELDIMLTTEDATGPEPLAERRLIWVGAPGGKAWRERPLRLGLEHITTFRPLALRALERAEIPWTIAVESDSTRTVEASISADLVVSCLLETTLPPYVEAVDHGGSLPDLPVMHVNLYVTDGPNAGLAQQLADGVREAYRTELPG